MFQQQQELEFRLCSYPSSQTGRNMQDYTSDKNVGANQRRLSVRMWETCRTHHCSWLFFVFIVQIRRRPLFDCVLQSLPLGSHPWLIFTYVILFDNLNFSSHFITYCVAYCLGKNHKQWLVKNNAFLSLMLEPSVTLFVVFTEERSFLNPTHFDLMYIVWYGALTYVWLYRSRWIEIGMDFIF